MKYYIIFPGYCFFDKNLNDILKILTKIFLIFNIDIVKNFN